MAYSPTPPDCSKLIEEKIVPARIKALRNWCIGGAIFIIYFGIIAPNIQMPIYIFWFLAIIICGAMIFSGRDMYSFRCPNCGEKIIMNLGIPKKCNHCLAIFKGNDS